MAESHFANIIFQKYDLAATQLKFWILTADSEFLEFDPDDIWSSHMGSL